MKDLIKEALVKANMTQKELAEKIHVTPQAVSQWIQGGKQPRWDNIKAMTKVFGFELGEKVLKKETQEKKIMSKQQKEIKDLNTFEKAQSEAESILEDSGINNYSRAVYSLLMWITTAAIGLVYHKHLRSKGADEKYDYEDIFFYLNDIVDDFTRGGEIEQSFYYMGGDLFESFGDCRIENHDYARECMNLWYKFKKAYDCNDESDFNKEFRVALLDVLTQKSCY